MLSDGRRLGIACVIDDRLPENFANRSATLVKVKAPKPDLFLVSGHERTAILAMNQIEESGAGVPMVAATHCRTAAPIPEPEKVRDTISATGLQTFFGPIKFDGRGRNSE